jgi:hypothetical protein
MLGLDVPFGSQAYQIGSLFTYSLFLIPGFNLILPVLLILTFNEVSTPGTRTNRLPLGARWILRPVPSAGSLYLLAATVSGIACTEATIKKNRTIQDPGDSEWGFGQTLAVFVAALPTLQDLSVVVSKKQGEAQVVADTRLKESIGGNDLAAIEKFIKAGANPNIRTHG